MGGDDPTDETLAVIASIFERSETKPLAQPDSGADDQKDQDRGGDAGDQCVTAGPTVEEKPLPDIDGYSKYGPGPLESLRFRWTARHDGHGNYYVDETIGTMSRPISTGPMPRDEVVAYIDERAREARAQYEALRIQILSGPSERGDDDGDREGGEGGEG